MKETAGGLRERERRGPINPIEKKPQMICTTKEWRGPEVRKLHKLTPISSSTNINCNTLASYNVLIFSNLLLFFSFFLISISPKIWLCFRGVRKLGINPIHIHFCQCYVYFCVFLLCLFLPLLYVLQTVIHKRDLFCRTKSNSCRFRCHKKINW